MSTLHLGSQAEFIRLVVPEQFTQEGWSQVNFEVSVKCFRGAVQAFLERSDFERLLHELLPLYSSLAGKAELSPLEAQVGFTLSGNGLGVIKASGFALANASFGSELRFEFELDQTYLPPFIAELQALLAGPGGGHA